jgi:hypothetical protein
MVDPLLTLAFAIHSNPGVYALLLGSGVSRSAGIPTGWGIVLDLVAKYAHLAGEETVGDPERWYRATFGREPDYAELIEALAKAPAERSRLLRAYFEPSPGDPEPNTKRPTRAHRAIAQFAARGFVRLIVTTNFDRLIETALHEAGVNPIVISTADGVEGAPPLAHSPCTLLKLHGDYIDMRIKNTPAELASYDPRITALLDRILDEYGLVVCGWSGEWDMALRDAISRRKSRRYTLYWAAHGDFIASAGELYIAS